ncbi:MAG: flippase-like domain-containing protein [Gammaproteobacteria bacterium]|nr:flippase-like domain-containing protein [Gammaproteobacteria bacterium]
MKKALLFFKIIVSVTLLTVLLVNVNWEEALQNIRKLDFLTLFIVLLLLSTQFPLSAFKWRIALNIHKLDHGFPYLLKLICIGFFFNNFLPTSIGGDVYRVIKTIPKGSELKSRALSAVLLERIFGLLALLTLGCIGALIIVKTFDDNVLRYYIGAYIAGVVALIVAVLLLGNRNFRRKIDFLLSIKKLAPLYENLKYIISDKGGLAYLLSVSIFFQVIAVTVVYTLFSALGVEDVWAKSAFLSAIIGIVAILPISINGIGVVEGSFVIAAVLVDINQTDAAIVAILLRIFVIPISIACGIVFAVDSRKSAA